MFRSFIAKTRPSRGYLLRSGDRSFRVSRSSPSVSSSQAPPPAEKFMYQAESSGKQTINLADELEAVMRDDKVMRNLMFAGFVLVGGVCYHVKEYVQMNNSKQEYIKVVSQAIKQIEQRLAIKQIELAAGDQADRAAAGDQGAG